MGEALKAGCLIAAALVLALQPAPAHAGERASGTEASIQVTSHHPGLVEHEVLEKKGIGEAIVGSTMLGMSLFFFGQGIPATAIPMSCAAEGCAPASFPGLWVGMMSLTVGGAYALVGSILVTVGALRIHKARKLMQKSSAARHLTFSPFLAPQQDGGIVGLGATF
jgi:hypothetical protein